MEKELVAKVLDSKFNTIEERVLALTDIAKLCLGYRSEKVHPKLGVVSVLECDPAASARVISKIHDILMEAPPTDTNFHVNFGPTETDYGKPVAIDWELA